ncbi:stage III sporulation protein AF [Paenibacillus borealis]|uniref:stage III sporulation protein AF n=1 Tax=Paenibacillus borealis TaxID=160799 RepID=UPI000693C673|nr:stage III sporulation protein AF [Paenibacillus borealis]
MSWLSGWLHELILVVLMAAFVEMLLPSKSMERYARLVLSLLVLLTMLNPIVSMLKGDASKELSLAMEQQERNGGLLSGAGDGADSLEKILADGRMLAEGARDQSLKLAAEEIAGQMRDQIAGSTGIRGVNVTVKLGMGPNPSAPLGEDVPLISSVTVDLPAAGAVAASGSPGSGTGSPPAANPASGPIRITPVEPVQVSLDNDGAASEGSDASAGVSPSSAAGNGAQEAPADAEAESIIKLLEQNWNLDPDLINVLSGGANAVKS